MISSTPPPHTGPVYPLTIQVDSQSSVVTDDSVSISVPRGHQVVLSIPEKRLNGYKWQVDMDDAASQSIQVVGDEYRLPPGPPNNVDQIGTHIVTLAVAATAPPTLALALSLRHSWSKTDPAVEQKHLTFTTT